ncbi:MAG TPA: MarR family transcriptional regulator [Thermomonospora sp.]|nr:MarR family transcriptional regulator [Thermomonospora sp.]
MQAISSVDRLTDGLGTLVTHLMKTAQGDIFRDILELDLSLSQVRALFLVDRAPSPPALHELADGLGLSLAATGRAVDALVRHTLAERHEDPLDRRVKRITPTPAGRELVARVCASRRDDMRRFAESLTEEERTGLVKALAPILNRPEFRALMIGPHC